MTGIFTYNGRSNPTFSREAPDIMSKGFDDIFDEVQQAKTEHARETAAGRSAEELEELLDDDAYHAYNEDKNRNLSSVLGTIQDEGPAETPSAPAGSPTPHDPLGQPGSGDPGMEDDVVTLGSTAPSTAGKQTRPSATPEPLPAFTKRPAEAKPSRYPLILITSAGAAITVLLGVSMFQIQNQADAVMARVESMEQTMAASQDQSSSLAATSARIAELRTRLDGLADTVAALGNRPPEPLPDADGEAMLNELRESQREALAKLEQQIESLRQAAVSTAKPPAATGTPTPAPVSAQPAARDWVINLATLSNPDGAKKLLAELREQGIQAEQRVTTVDGKTLYRLRVTGFADRNSAQAHAQELKKTPHLSDAWVTRDARAGTP